MTMKKSNYKKTHQSPNTIDEKLRDFLDDDYNKVYYLIQNEYGDVRGRQLNHSNELCKEAKRMSLFKYYDADEDNMKAKHRTTINKLVIDADEGVYNTLFRLQGLIRELGLEYWIIRGTDKKTKSIDSGSIIIKFKRERIDKKRFATLVKCLNIHSGGDLLNIGYMFKNPQWNYVKGFEKITNGNDIISFDDLYNGILNYYNTTAEGINKQHIELSQKEFEIKLLAELSKEIPDPHVVKSLYYRTAKTPELTQKVEKYLNNSERVKKHKMSKKQYAKYLIIWDVFFGQNNKNNSPKSLKEQFNITDKEVNYWNIQVKEEPLFNPFNPLIFSIKQIQSYGFNSQEVEHILLVQKIMSEKGQKTKKENRDAKRNRIIYLNQKVFEQKITDDELIELYKLTKHKNYENLTFTIKGKSQPIEQSLLLVKVHFSYDKKKYQKEYIDENNNILTKEYIVEYYLGGCAKSNFTKQISVFGIKQYSRNWDENRNLIKKQQNRESRENLKKARKELKQKKAADKKLKYENEIINKMRKAEIIDQGWCYYDDGFNYTQEYKFNLFKKKIKEWVRNTIYDLKRLEEHSYIPPIEIKREDARIEELKRYAKDASVSLPFVPPFVRLLKNEINKK
jgi:hypothetical protein